MNGLLKRRIEDLKRVLPCNHMYVDGFGGMGDAVVCAKCGVDKYPEAAPGYHLAKLLGRVILEAHPEYEAWADLARSARVKRAKRLAQ